MRVIEGKRRPVEERAPPGGARAHAWQGAAAGGTPAFLEAGLADELGGEAERAAGRSEEALALLVGDRFADPASGAHFAVATARVTGPLVSSPARVRFDTRGFSQVARALDEVPFDYLVVGWFHSHVGLGVRPSAVDEATHARYFRAPHQFALILDPVRRQAAAYGLRGGHLAPRPLSVFDAAAYLP